MPHQGVGKWTFDRAVLPLYDHLDYRDIRWREELHVGSIIGEVETCIFLEQLYIAEVVGAATFSGESQRPSQFFYPP